MIVIGLVGIFSCANNQDRPNKLKVVDTNLNEIFSITNTEVGYLANRNEIDLYIRKDLKLPDSYSLDYVELVFSEEEEFGTVVVQYIDDNLYQVPIVFTISKQKVNDIEILSIGNNGKKYQCKAETGIMCVGCCEVYINNKATATCSCESPVFGESICMYHPDGECSFVEIQEPSGQGN